MTAWRLDGRRAFVSGGTKGIGRAVVEELSALGAIVMFCARNASEVDEATKATGARGIVSDVTTGEGRGAIVAAIRDSHSKLDVLVNNVGTNLRKAFTEYTDEEIGKLLEVN